MRSLRVESSLIMHYTMPLVTDICIYVLLLLLGLCVEFTRDEALHVFMETRRTARTKGNDLFMPRLRNGIKHHHEQFCPIKL